MLLRISSATLILSAALYLTHLAAQALQSEVSRSALVSAQINEKYFSKSGVDDPMPTKNAVTAPAKKNQLSAFETLQSFESGQRTSTEIREEITMLAGDTSPVSWGAIKADQDLRLSAILSHVRNLEDNFEILMLHTLSADGRPDDVVTHYTSRISEADQKNIHNTLIVAHKLVQKKGAVTISEKSRQAYNFFLAPQELAGSFRLQKPQGAFSFTEATPDAFDPLTLLKENFGQNQEVDDGTFEVQVADRLYLVTLTVRQTELETVTIEVEMREKDAISSQTFILIYE